MDRRLLEYYRRELVYMREMGGEFARENPKIAQRLGRTEDAVRSEAQRKNISLKPKNR